MSAAAEAIQVYRNQPLSDEDFKYQDGSVQTLATLELSSHMKLLDLTSARVLDKWDIQPPTVATYDRNVTQQLSARLFEKGIDGFLWWSTLEASWTNITLFQSRIRKKLRATEPLRTLNTDLPEVRSAAKHLKIQLI